MFDRVALYGVHVAIAILATACCQTGSQLNPVGKLDGYMHVFPYPRTDIPPGTVIVIWDKPVKGKVDPVCRPEEIGNPAVRTPPGAINFSNEEEATLKADSSVRVRKAIEAKFGGSRVKHIATKMEVRPVVLADSYASVSKNASNSSTCRANAQWYKRGYGNRIRAFSLVTEAALVTFTHTAELSSDVGIGAQVDIIKSPMDASADLQIKWESSSRIEVSGDGVYTNYNVESSSLKLP